MGLRAKGPLGLMRKPVIDDQHMLRAVWRAAGIAGRPRGPIRSNPEIQAFVHKLKSQQGLSDHAVEEMKRLSDPRGPGAKAVGTDWLEGHGYSASNPPAGYWAVGCIKYVKLVVAHAYEQTEGRRGRRIAQHLGRTIGDKDENFFNYLVERLGWTAVYLNPDVYHPKEGAGEVWHVKHYWIYVRRLSRYMGVPIHYKAMNYDPTPAGHHNFGKALQEWEKEAKAKGQTLNRDLRQHLNTPTQRDISATGIIHQLKKIKFGVGFSKRFSHTWLYSYGKIWEAHWDERGSNVFDRGRKSLFNVNDWPWKSSVLILPPDALSERLQDLY